MTGDRLRRYSWQRTTRPRRWPALAYGDSPSASHRTPKTGGHSSVRAHLLEERAREAGEFPFPELTVNEVISDGR